MAGVLAHALPRVCEIVGAAAGGHQEVDKTEKREETEREKEEREAASHALELVHEIHRKVNVDARLMADSSYTLHL